jgi:hypothetical protein
MPKLDDKKMPCANYKPVVIMTTEDWCEEFILIGEYLVLSLRECGMTREKLYEIGAAAIYKVIEKTRGDLNHYEMCKITAAIMIVNGRF